MATEIFMSCTCTSVVRGTANSLLFLPSPHLSAEAFQEIPPTWAGEVRHGPPGCSAQCRDLQGVPPTLGWPHLPFAPHIAPVPSWSCPIVSK